MRMLRLIADGFMCAYEIRPDGRIEVHGGRFASVIIDQPDLWLSMLQAPPQVM